VKGSAKKAIISASLRDEVPVFAMDMNHNEYKGTDTVFSNVSYITKCLAPPRKAVGKVLSIANGKLLGTDFGVTLSDVSVVDPTARLEKWAKHEDIASAVQEYAAGETKGALN